MGLQTYSQHSFYSLSKQLKPMGPLVRFDLQIRVNRVNERIHLFLEKRSINFKVGVYGELGRGENSEALSRDLLCYLNEQHNFDSQLQSFWAVFYDTGELTDQEFETRVWHELKYISSALQMNIARGLSFKPRTVEKNISLNIGEEQFFVTGLHRNSEDSSRQFHYATLVFSKDESLYPYQSH